MKIKKLAKGIRKVNKLKKKHRYQLKSCYAQCLKEKDIVKNRILFESFHGKNISDSPLYVLRELMASGRADEFEIFYSSARPEEHRGIVEALGLPVRLVDIDSFEYMEVMATAKYLLNNSSFPQYFIKREGQVYVQTWHGVPLKTLGKRMRLGMESMYNVQHNFLHADYLTFPNEFTREVMMRDYNLDKLYSGKVAMIGYPRNDIFRDEEAAARIREKYGLEGLETLAYMPTWRGTSNHSVDVDDYRDQLTEMLSRLDQGLRDDQRIYVNFHSMVADKIKLDSYRHILPFPADADNYEFLNAVDGLITDYSSVFFDYAITGRPIILFIYDEDQYRYDRGMYFGVGQLPFCKVRSLEELADCLKTGSYRDFDYRDDEKIKGFLEYETENNSGEVLSLLLGEPACRIMDYKDNRKRSWRLRELGPVTEVEDLKTLATSVDAGRDLLVLYKNQFSQEMSAWLYDNHRDDINYIFLNDDNPISFREMELSLVKGRVRKELAARDSYRRYPGLALEDCPGDFALPEAGSRIISRSIGRMAVEAAAGAEALRISWQDKTASAGGPVRLIAADTNNVLLWQREVSDSERKDKCIVEDFRDLLKSGRIKKNYSINLLLETADGKGGVRLVYPVCKACGSGQNISGYSYLGTLRPDLSAYSPEEKAASRFLSSEGSHGLAAYCLGAGGRLKLMPNLAPDDLRLFICARLDKLSISGSRLTCRLSLETSGLEVDSVKLVYRDGDEARYGDFAWQQSGSSMDCSLDLSSVDLRETYWDMLIFGSYQGRRITAGILGSDRIGRKVRLADLKYKDGDMALIPYLRKSGHAAFIYREASEYETRGQRAKEALAYLLVRLGRSYWRKKKIWLVFEKFCSLAQDNGYYFFQYCMEQEKAARGSVFYVIDKRKSDYDRVKKYGRNVIQFMSFRHILYAMAARIYVGSDSKSHLYTWRSRPSLALDMINKKKIFFLQHGVTAMKRVDHIFGKGGVSPMSYFLTTSENEQDIVTSYFGYDRSQAPVLGFSRWDVLRDCSDKEAPFILIMPTWRQWLESVSDEEFRESEFFNRYLSIINDPRMTDLLERYNVGLKFYIHPKLSETIKLFSSKSDRVELIVQGTRPLNRIMMESSMLITDYSSVCWDMLFMDKPVIYYHFDQERYLKEIGSYIDFDTALPGRVCKDDEELLAGLREYLEKGFSLDEGSRQKLSGWYAYRDEDNRKRTYDFIRKL